MKTRIGFLLSDIARGGAAISAYLLIKNLNKEFFDVFVFVGNKVSDEGFLKDFKKHIVSIKVFPMPVIRAYDSKSTSSSNLKTLCFNLLYRKKALRFLEIIKEHRIGIFHINTTLYSYLVPIIKKQLQIPVIFHVRESLQNYKKITFKFVSESIKQSDKIICISENEAMPFKKTNNCVIIPNPFDFSTINSKTNIKDKQQLIGMLGTFKYIKKPHLFLKAIKLILQDDPEYNHKFVILGSCHKRPYWVLIAKILLKFNWYHLYFRILYDYYCYKHQISKSLLFYDRTKDIGGFFQDLLIYVRPSGHPWGRDIIEAMAYGTPVIATGKSSFFLKNDVSGILVDENNPHSLAKSIIRLSRDKVLMSALATNAYSTVRNMCDVNYHVDVVTNIYKAALSSSAANTNWTKQ